MYNGSAVRDVHLIRDYAGSALCAAAHSLCRTDDPSAMAMHDRRRVCIYHDEEEVGGCVHTGCGRSEFGGLHGSCELFVRLLTCTVTAVRRALEGEVSEAVRSDLYGRRRRGCGWDGGVPKAASRQKDAPRRHAGGERVPCEQVPRYSARVATEDEHNIQRSWPGCRAHSAASRASKHAPGRDAKRARMRMRMRAATEARTLMSCRACSEAEGQDGSYVGAAAAWMLLFIRRKG
ncbi:hypothetical protein BC628DRAFT_210699 [Trametes gibbosa]|nr:hypothetical protein BC628DRAFT_210699 [Trametes gibbosa]